MISLRKIIKKYSDKPILDKVDITIEKGKITSIIGPNGAGKSTLLSIASRLLDKDSGEVLIDGDKIQEVDSSDLAKKLSILRQSNFINMRIRVEELIAFGRFPYSKGRLDQEDRQKIEEAIHYMSLDDLRHRFLDELSGGQAQRAFIAMTIAQDTDYILLDEPLNNLDMKHSVQIMQTLRRLVQDFGKTIVLVIHDINFASAYSDNIVALKNGHVVIDDTVDEVMKEEVLSKIYDMKIDIQEYQGRKICVYFDPMTPVQDHCVTAHKLMN